jgi:hypothetical protein
MTITFTARAVGVDEDAEVECLTAGVAEDDSGTGMVLLFMCGLNEPDIEALLDVDDDTIDQFRVALRRVMAYGRPDARPVRIEL